MRNIRLLGTFAFLLATVLSPATFLSCRTRPATKPAQKVVLTVTSDYLDLEEKDIRNFEKEKGISVQMIPTLESTSDRLLQYREWFQERSSTPDVLHLDVIWPAMFSDDLIDLGPSLGKQVELRFPNLIDDIAVNGRLVAVPMVVNLGLLYYRADLLQKYGFAHPPRSFPELEHMARVIQRGERRTQGSSFWGYVFQGASYEGLSCNALEWLHAADAGPFLARDRTFHLKKDRAIRALRQASDWVNTISPPGVIAYKEQDAWNVFKAGRAAFMRNWSYYYSTPDSKKGFAEGSFAIAQIPSGGVFGGALLSASRYSKHQKEALEFISFVTEARARETTIASTAVLPTSQISEPGLSLLDSSILRSAILRPSSVAGPAYDAVSRKFYTTVHSVLARQQTAEEAMATLERELPPLLVSPPPPERPRP